MKLSDALVCALRQLGVRYVFGVSGANIEHLHDAIHRLGGTELKSVLAKCESGAAFMADAYARVHRELGVCCATSGGGMTNLLTGVAESYAESVPVLALVGQPPMSLWDKGAFQDSSGLHRTVKGEQLWQSVSKYVGVVKSASEFWPFLSTAILACLSGRPGPSVILLPRDIYDQDVSDLTPNWGPDLLRSISSLQPILEDIERLKNALQNAKAPVLVIGHGVRRSPSGSAVIQFATTTGIPVASTLSARGEYPNDADNYLGCIGVAGHPSVHRYINDKADLIVVVGSGLNIMTKGPLGEALNKKQVVFVNIDTAALHQNYPDKIAISGDDGEVFSALLAEIKTDPLHFDKLNSYALEIFKPTLITPPVKDNEESSLLQSEAIFLLNEILPENGHLVYDAGDCAAAAMHFSLVPRGTSSTIALGMGGMGYAIGGAIGAQIGSPAGTRTVAFVGDGAFLMSGLEIHTAVDLGLPILYVVFNNNMHGMCLARQRLFFEGRIEASTYSPFSVAQVARGLGPENKLWVSQASSASELKSRLEEYKQNLDKPGVLELRISQEELPPFTPFLATDAPTTTLLRRSN